MIIRSSRIRRVETPEASTPGVVPPAETGVPATAPTGSTKPSKGLLIGLLAGGAAVLLIAIIAVVAFVLPSLSGGSPVDMVDVADISSEPETSWKFDWVGDNDEEFLDDSPNYTSVGDTEALVWSTFDSFSFSESQGDSFGWYEGYDEEYEEGYAAGEDYNSDYQIWYDDPTTTYETVPEIENYFPEGAYDNYDEFLGFNDGFWDAYNEDESGTSKKVKPADPDYTPNLTLLNVVNGQEKWTIDLSDAIDDADYESYFQVYDVEGSPAVAVVASLTDGYALVTIDKGSGEVISELDSDGSIDVAPFQGDLIVAIADEDGENSTIGRYAVNAIDDDPKWEADVDGSPYVYIEGEFVVAYGDDEGVVFDAASGKEAEFGDDIDYTTSYSFVGTQLLRLESKDDGDSYEVEGWNIRDDSTWKDSVKADQLWVLDGALFVADSKGEGYSDLQRLNPANGEELWGDAYGDGFDEVLGVQGNSVLLSDGNKIVVVDLANGKDRYSEKVGEFPSVLQGSRSFYVYSDEELAAFGYGEKGDIWTLDLDDDEGILVLGKQLVLVDYDKGTLHGLVAG